MDPIKYGKALRAAYSRVSKFSKFPDVLYRHTSPLNRDSILTSGLGSTWKHLYKELASASLRS